MLALRLVGVGAGFAAPGLRPAAAEVTRNELAIIARALGFMERPPSGLAELGIAFPAGSAAGRAEAQQIADAFGAEGVRAGALVLKPRLVPTDEVARAPVVALLLGAAAASSAGQLAQALADRGIATVTTDRALVERGEAVMAVRSAPRVEILVSRAAAQRAGVSFSAAFRMMIQER